MGLIRSGLNAFHSTMTDGYKDFFYCEALPSDVLVVKGRNRGKGNDNIITSGSGVSVADGQCMMIVEQGQVVEISAESGEFIYDASTEPSFFTGSLSGNIKNVLDKAYERFTYGGQTAKDQRVYYFNMKEMPGNKFGTAMPIPFRVVDKNINLDIDVSVRCHGTYSYKIIDPFLFYTNVCGNVSREFRRSEIEGQMKTELMNAMQPAFAKISALGVRPYEIPGRVEELSRFLNEVLSAKWQELRGIAIVSVAINSVTLPEEDEDLIKQAQRAAILRDPGMAGATLVDAKADAMKAAARNSGGAVNGFMGMNMAGQSVGDDVMAFYQNTKPKGESWTCSCGTVNTGKFCSECGKAKPWQCSCGALNTGKFCVECGKPKEGQE